MIQTVGPYKQTGLAQIGPIHPPPSFSCQQAILRPYRLNNVRKICRCPIEYSCFFATKGWPLLCGRRRRREQWRLVRLDWSGGPWAWSGTGLPMWPHHSVQRRHRHVGGLPGRRRILHRFGIESQYGIMEKHIFEIVFNSRSNLFQSTDLTFPTGWSTNKPTKQGNAFFCKHYSQDFLILP